MSVWYEGVTLRLREREAELRRKEAECESLRSALAAARRELDARVRSCHAGAHLFLTDDQRDGSTCVFCVVPFAQAGKPPEAHDAGEE